VTADAPTTGLRSGVCSIAFRALDADEVIALAQRAALDGIEWGADVHVPPGDEARAADVARRTADAGLATPSYGSYLGLHGGLGRADAEPVMASAAALGVRNVRVWAGALASAEADPDERSAIVDAIAAWCEVAADFGLIVSLEHHAGTLTDTLPTTLAVLAHVGAPNLRAGWQPRDPAGPSDLTELDALTDRLAHVHVFWWRDYLTRFPLADGAEFWAEALERARQAPPLPAGDRFAFIEFVRDDDPDQLVADAATLHSLLGAVPR
jgi:sugar phosphate isomerase/epimerase